MKILLSVIKYILFFITVLSQILSISKPVVPFEATYENMGIPLKDYYPDGIVARTAWDVEIYNDKLFVASGDYDKNSGPVNIFYYDLINKKWVDNGLIPDEQIQKFIIWDNALMIPGYDPKDDWSYGNIYALVDDKWITYRSVPGGIHQFDLTNYQNNLFVGLGVSPGDYPAAISFDNGNTFEKITFFKNGEAVDTTVTSDTTFVQIRVYNFFILNDTLYAFFTNYSNHKADYEIYKYEDGAFYYHSNLPEKISFQRFSFDYFRSNVQLNGKVYFSTGNLYVTEDMADAKQINLDNALVADLRVIENHLYVLTTQKTADGKYQTSVWKQSYAESFQMLFYFTFDAAAQSFTYDDGVFYFGMGDGILSEINDANGTVLRVEYYIK